MLIITGTIAYDYIMNFPGAYADHILPDQIHNINLSFIVDTFARRRGGTAGNVSYGLGLLKTQHTLFSVAGKDFAEYKKALVQLGIALNGIKVDKNDYTATGFAMTDNKDNQIWGYFYGAAKAIPNLRLKKVVSSSDKAMADKKKDDLVLIGPSGAAGSMNFVHQCIKMGIEYMFDPGFILTQVSLEDLTLGVKHARYLIGNEYEMTVIRDRIPHAEQLLVGKTIITTLGEKGSLIEHAGKVYTIGCVTPKEVIDPTGAGDAWRAGFLAGLEQEFDLQTCGQMGAVLSAYAIENYGTQEYTCTKKEFAERYRQAFGSLIEL